MRTAMIYPVGSALSIAGLHLIAPETIMYYVPVAALGACVQLAVHVCEQKLTRTLPMDEQPIEKAGEVELAAPPASPEWSLWESQMRSQLAANSDWFADERRI